MRTATVKQSYRRVKSKQSRCVPQELCRNFRKNLSTIDELLKTNKISAIFLRRFLCSNLCRFVRKVRNCGTCHSELWGLSNYSLQQFSALAARRAARPVYRVSIQNLNVFSIKTIFVTGPCILNYKLAKTINYYCRIAERCTICVWGQTLAKHAR
jgi:hypothetical protein